MIQRVHGVQDKSLTYKYFLIGSVQSNVTINNTTVTFRDISYCDLLFDDRLLNWILRREVILLCSYLLYVVLIQYVVWTIQCQQYHKASNRRHMGNRFTSVLVEVIAELIRKYCYPMPPQDKQGVVPFGLRGQHRYYTHIHFCVLCQYKKQTYID